MDEQTPTRRHLGGHPSIEVVVVTVAMFVLTIAVGIAVAMLGFPPIIADIIRFALLVGFMVAIDHRGASWALRSMGFREPVVRPLLVGVLMGLLLVSLPLLVIVATVLTGENARLAPGWPILAVDILIGPGFFEEGLARGYLFNHFYTYSKFSWPMAAMLSGVLFALLHLLNLIAGASPADTIGSIMAAFVLSFALGFMFLRMGKIIWGALAAHVTYDLPIIIFNLPGDAPQDAGELIVSTGYLVIVTVFAILVTDRLYPAKREAPVEEERLAA